MRRVFFAVILITALLALNGPAAAQQQTPAVVRAVLFWQQGCPNCETVINEILPELQSQYGAQLDVQLIEVNTMEDVARLYQVGAAFGLAKEDVGVPFVVIGDQALVGAVEIPAKLPGLVESYLAAGGSAAPDLEQLASGQAAPAAVEAEPQNDGMIVAWAVTIGMLTAVIWAGVVLYRALQGRPLGKQPAWVDWSIPLLALAGLGVALYMTYIEVTHVQAICGPLGDCNAVQNSPYATLFGWLPVGILGLLGYIGILAAWAWGRYRRDSLAEYAPAALLGMTLFGTIFSIYLTYLEIFVIFAVCVWCISSAILITLLMLASLPGAAAWLAAAEEGEA